MKNLNKLSILALIPLFYACTPNVPSVQKSLLAGGSGSLNGSNSNPIINDITNGNPASSVAVPLVDSEVFNNMNEDVDSGNLTKVTLGPNLDQFRVTGNTLVADESTALVPIAAYIEFENEATLQSYLNPSDSNSGGSAINNNCEIRMTSSQLPSRTHGGSGEASSIKFSWVATLSDISLCSSRSSILRDAKSLTLFFKPKDSTKTFN